LKIENKQSELRKKNNFEKGSKKFGDSKVKLDICNRFEREVNRNRR